METDPSRMCECFVDLPDINVRGVEGDYREPLTIHFESRRAVVGCPEYGVVASVKDRPLVISPGLLAALSSSLVAFSDSEGPATRDRISLRVIPSRKLPLIP